MIDAAPAVLIVEDERIIAEDLRQSLQHIGYDAYAIAGSADEAVSRASERRPDVVLMDIRIHGPKDGVATAEILQQRFGTPIVFMTAHSDDATIHRAKHTEPYGYLVKPVKMADLRVALELALHRSKADRRVRERERWFRTTLASIPDAVITVDPGNTVRYMNRPAEVMTGSDAEHSEGRPFHDVVKLHRQPDLAPANVMRERRAFHRDETELAGPSGARLVSEQTSPVLDGEDLLGGVVVLRDVTARRELLRQIELTHRLASLGSLAAGIAHDVNTPLAVISANVEHLMDPDAPPDVRSSDNIGAIMLEIREATSRITQIVGDLSILGKPDNVHVNVNRGRGSVKTALAWALRVTHHELRHRAHIVVDITEAPDVTVDEPRLGHAFVNLLLHAALSSRDGADGVSEVRVTVSAEGDAVVVAVAERGVVLPPDVLPGLTQPLDLGVNGADRVLGLPIADAIARAAGGSMSIERRPGEGTTVRMRLPAAPSTARSAAEVVPRPANVPHERFSILAVDDEPLMRRVVERVIGREHEVTVEESAASALGRIRDGERFDVILSDLMMPGLSGLDFYAQVASVSPDQASRFIFLSGGVVDPDMDRELAALTSPIIEKPFVARTLLDAVRFVVDLRGTAERPKVS